MPEENKKYFSSFMTCFKRIKLNLEEYNKIIIYGEPGTGKTGFIMDLFEDPDINLKIVDKNIKSNEIIDFLGNSSMFFNKNVVIYDDITAKKSIIKDVGLYIKSKFRKMKFIMIIEKLERYTEFYASRTGFSINETRYPNNQELLKYIDYMREYTGIDYSRELISTLMKLKPRDMRRIEFTLLDGYYSGIKKEKKEKYHITKSGSFILSLGIAENLPRLRKLKNSIIEADKLKKNEKFYLDYLKCFYPRIENTRLRYPSGLLEIVKKGKMK